jgi:hypothetical protein
VHRQFVDPKHPELSARHLPRFRVANGSGQCVGRIERVRHLFQPETKGAERIGAEDIDIVRGQNVTGGFAMHDHRVPEIATDNVVHEIANRPLGARRRSHRIICGHEFRVAGRIRDPLDATPPHRSRDDPNGEETWARVETIACRTPHHRLGGAQNVEPSAAQSGVVDETACFAEVRVGERATGRGTTPPKPSDGSSMCGRRDCRGSRPGRVLVGSLVARRQSEKRVFHTRLVQPGRMTRDDYCVAQASGMVSVQVHCTPDETLTLMEQRGAATRQSLNAVAVAVVERSLRFDSAPRSSRRSVRLPVRQGRF